MKNTIFLILFAIFVSYQGWINETQYIVGYVVTDYDKPVSSYKNLEEIAKTIKDKNGFYKVIILNWRRMESE